MAEVLNNGVGNATICASAEVIALAEQHGISAKAIIDIMREGAGTGASVALDRHGPEMAPPATARGRTIPFY